MRAKGSVSLAMGLWIMLLLISPAEASTPFQKLGRGTGNLLTGWLELPVQMMQTTESQGSFSGISVGFLKGLLFGAGRTALGAFEMVTFLLPNHAGERGPADDPYAPIVEPEFIVFRSADKT